VQAARLKDSRWVDILAELLDDDTEIVRQNADYALFQIARSAPEIARARRSAWLTSEKPLIRARALNLFADLDPKNTFPELLKALRDRDPAVRFLARVMVLEHYYRDTPEAAAARAQYLAHESDPAVLSLYARLYQKKP
jgi:HEAT repeat protein